MSSRSLRVGTATLGIGGAASATWKGRSLGQRWQVLLLLGGLATVGLRLVTYDPLADGPWTTFAAGVALTVVCAGVAWGVVRLASNGRSVLPFVAALGVLLPSDVVHFVRRTQPIARTQEYVLADDFQSTPSGSAPAETRWLPELQPGASAQVNEGRLEVQAPPNTRGFVGLRLGYELDPNRNPFWLPRGAFAPPAGEVLEWEASVERQNALAVVMDTRTVRVEATEFGLRVTYLLLDGSLDGADLEVPEVARGETVRYRLERTPERPLQRLLIGEKEVWARPKPPGTWEFVRFGATRTDDQHGGRLVVDDVRYRAIFGGGGDGTRSSCPGGALFC